MLNKNTINRASVYNYALNHNAAKKGRSHKPVLSHCRSISQRIQLLLQHLHPILGQRKIILLCNFAVSMSHLFTQDMRGCVHFCQPGSISMPEVVIPETDTQPILYHPGMILHRIHRLQLSVGQGIHHFTGGDKQDTARHSQVCWKDTSATSNSKKQIVSEREWLRLFPLLLADNEKRQAENELPQNKQTAQKNTK